MDESLSSVETALVMASAEGVMSANGKSFYFASLFFSKQVMARVSVLYSICRYIDDCADEHEITLAQHKVARIKRVIQSIKDGQEPQTLEVKPQDSSGLWFRDRLSEVLSWGVMPIHLLELVEGAESDLRHHGFTSDPELYRYCFQVAGVVGLMMCPLIGVTHRKALRHAVDLGIGMQLTNICRDVAEDFQNGRRYLPELTSTDLSKSLDEKIVARAVSRHLEIADEFYRSGYQGLSYIPLRARLVILFAGEIYRHIGCKIRERQFQVLDGRVVLGTGEKILVIMKSLKYLLSPWFWRPGKHRSIRGYEWSSS